MTAARETRTPVSLSALVNLTDAAQTLFATLYDVECARKADLRARLVAELTRLELFDAHEHYADHDDYAIGGPEQ